MTPHDLINLPHAGMAEKQLRKQGDWLLTREETTQKAMDDLAHALAEVNEAYDTLEELTT